MLDLLGTSFSPACNSLVYQLLRRNPVERISFEEFFAHPFLSGASTGLTSMHLPVPPQLRPMPPADRNHARAQPLPQHQQAVAGVQTQAALQPPSSGPSTPTGTQRPPSPGPGAAAAPPPRPATPSSGASMAGSGAGRAGGDAAAAAPAITVREILPSRSPSPRFVVPLSYDGAGQATAKDGGGQAMARDKQGSYSSEPGPPPASALVGAGTKVGRSFFCRERAVGCQPGCRVWGAMGIVGCRL